MPLVAASALEAGVALWSDRLDRRRLVLFGQAGLAASLVLGALARSPWGLSVGLALAGTCSGIACSAGQAILVSAEMGGAAGGADRAMVRWSLLSAIGDLLAPLAVSAATALGASYRAAMLGVAAVVAVQCLFAVASLRRPAGSAAVTEDEAPPVALRVALRRVARSPRLWAWLFAAASCTLLDELVVALGALHLERDLSCPRALSAGVALAFASGSVVGAALLSRLVRDRSSPKLLLLSALVCLGALGLFLYAASPVSACAALFLVAVAAAPHHPLALARAYALFPDSPGAVQAALQLFVVVDVGAPLALGLVADRYGLRVALGALALQPVVILVCALSLRSER